MHACAAVGFRDQMTDPVSKPMRSQQLIRYRLLQRLSFKKNVELLVLQARDRNDLVFDVPAQGCGLQRRQRVIPGNDDRQTKTATTPLGFRGSRIGRNQQVLQGGTNDSANL